MVTAEDAENAENAEACSVVAECCKPCLRTELDRESCVWHLLFCHVLFFGGGRGRVLELLSSD